MSLTVCACVNKPNVEAVQKIVNSSLASKAKNIIFGSSPSDFNAVKASGEKAALFIEGPAAHGILKDMCDDYQSPDRRVKFIYSLTAGVDAYKLHDIRKEVDGIPIHNAQGLYSNILAEHVNFSMMYFNRFPWRLNASKKEKKWDRFNMIEMKGQKMLIFGYGDIGSQCGRIAVQLGMEVTGVRRTVKAPVDEFGVHIVSDGEALLGDADFVVGVLPGTDATKQFFNLELFKKMKPSAVFINIGRGVTQCEADICEALDKNIIRGAALDVFEVEPLPESSPLWAQPDDKLLLSAHCADWTDSLITSSAERFVKIFESYNSTGTSDAYTVSVDKGY